MKGGEAKSVQNSKPLYVGVDEVSRDWGCSKSKAYGIIIQLSEQMKKRKSKTFDNVG